MQKAQNVLANAYAPVDFRNEGQLMGTAGYVAVEVAVSKLVRTVLKMEPRSITELAFVHLLSIPFMGGAGAPFGASTPLRGTADYTTAFKDGAKGIPAVLVAQWVYQTAYSGFHMPWFNLKDLLIIAGSKTITRPLVYSVYDKLPDALDDGFAVIDELIRRQTNNSNIKSKD